MTDERVPEGLVEEMAEDYGLDAGRLGAALSEALDAYEDERDFWTWRDGEAYAHRDDVGRVLTAARRAQRLWAELTPEAREEVRFFQGGKEDDPVGSWFHDAISLLDEYRVHYAKQPGNPGTSRTGDAGDLRPLKAFARMLMWFWVTQTDEPFGHVVERQDDVEGYDPDMGEKPPRAAESKAIEFLDDCASCLRDHYEVSYTEGNLETVVRNIKQEAAELAGT